MRARARERTRMFLLSLAVEHRRSVSEALGLGALHNDVPLGDVVDQAATHEENHNAQHDVGVRRYGVLDQYDQPDHRRDTYGDGDDRERRRRRHDAGTDRVDQRRQRRGDGQREDGLGDDDPGRRREQEHAVRRAAVIPEAGNENSRR